MVDNSDILHECWTACVGSLKHFWAQLLHGTKTTQQHNKDSVFRDTQSHATHTHTLTRSRLNTRSRTHGSKATDETDIICRVTTDRVPVGKQQEYSSVTRLKPSGNRYYHWVAHKKKKPQHINRIYKHFPLLVLDIILCWQNFTQTTREKHTRATHKVPLMCKRGHVVMDLSRKLTLFHIFLTDFTTNKNNVWFFFYNLTCFASVPKGSYFRSGCHLLASDIRVEYCRLSASSVSLIFSVAFKSWQGICHTYFHLFTHTKYLLNR